MSLSKIKISYLVIVGLLAIIVLQRNCQPKHIDDTSVVTDTIWKIQKDTIYKKVNIVERVYIKPKGEKYSSGETLDTCKSRFQNLLKEHLVRTVYTDTLVLDSLGTIVVKDTVWLNKLYGKRSYTKDYKIPFVTKTITKKEDPKRQVYIGMNLFANRNDVTAFSPGFIYKNKKDQLYQASVGVSFNGTITYGFGTYWKIKIK